MLEISEDLKNKWIETAKIEDYKFVFVIFDSEDKDFFPYYCNNSNESRKFVSITKCKVIEIIKI